MNLSNSRVFQGLSEAQLEAFLAACKEETIRQGEELIVMGKRGTCVYFLVEGELRVFLPGKDREDVARLSPPAVVGEMEFLTGLPRSASVQAATDAKLLSIPFDTLRKRLHDDDISTLKVVHNIATVLALRLSSTMTKLAEIEQTAEARPEELLAFRQKLFSDWSF
jgi:CRP-like cAMP-binding protein